MADNAPDLHASVPPPGAESIVFPFAPPAPDASVVEVAPGILWLRMPMPMQLDHINIYLLRDGSGADAGWYIVDTGLNTPACKALWEEVVATRLDGLPLKGLVCTHFHYDHAGLARWLTDRYAIPLWMTHGEFFTMRALGERLPEPAPEGLVLFHQRAGMPEERIARMLAGLRKDPFMPPQPESFRRLRAGDRLEIGGRRWQIVVGEGHSPEHACLYCAGPMPLGLSEAAYREATVATLERVLAAYAGANPGGFVAYISGMGADAGSALILLLLTLKTLELRARRDAFVIFFLGFFALLSHFLFSQSLLTALGILVGVLALLAALVNAHTPAGYPPLRQSLFIALRMALLGAPIMFALFMLFPRFAPLWGFPAHESAKTGLSDKMTVGTIAELALDDSVAFRVRFDGGIPRRQDLYFRGPVLGRLQGQTWTSEETFAVAESPTASETNAGATVTYEMLLQPHQRQWLLTLEMATQRPELPAGWRALQMRSMEWISLRPVVDVLRYRASSQLQNRHGTDVHPALLRTYLDLPPGLNPRTRELAHQLLNDPALAQGSGEQKVQAVLQRLRTGGYTYTLAHPP